MQAVKPFELLKDSETQRRTMVECQIRTFDVTEQRLIARFMDVPRESFLPDHVRSLAYSDIGFVVPAGAPEQEARYLLPPLVLARLIQGARVKSSDRVLDVAPGTGYSTAILGGLAREVVALETGDALHGELADRLSALGRGQVRTVEGPLAEGSPANGPFDVIVVNGAVQTNLENLFAQLVEGGRLVVLRCNPDEPTARASKAMCYEKHGESLSGRFLFDASAPCLRAFQSVPQFVF